MTTNDQTLAPPRTSSCCGGPAKSPAPPPPEEVRDQVRAGYARIAETGAWSADLAVVETAGGCGPADERAGGGCCGGATFSPEQLAAAIGYSKQDLEATPAGANLGLSCGNPTALASL